MAAVSKSTSIRNDVRGKVSKEEWEQRVNLAALYRIIAHYGWDDHIFTHITARVPDAPDQFLVNPLGLCFDEITASSLLKIDSKGDKVLESDYPLNWAAYIIHSAVYVHNPEAVCAVHLHTKSGTAVSSQPDGLLPLTQFAHLVGDVSYHEYEGIAVDESECERLGKDFAGTKAMILRNHGTLTWGRSIPEAFALTYNLERACEVQVLAQAGGPVHMPPQKALDANQEGNLRRNDPNSMFLVLSWDAVLRKVDRLDASFRD